jgi:hypothetical protein
MTTISALLLPGGGPPVEVEALADGSPPPTVELPGVWIMARCGPGRVVLRQQALTWALEAHQPASGQAPVRYRYARMVPTWPT